MRARAGFGVPLKTEGRRICALNALQRAIEQRLMRGFKVGWQRSRVDRESVVLARDQYRIITHILHWMIRTMVTQLHFYRLCPAGKREELAAETNAEERYFLL